MRAALQGTVKLFGGTLRDLAPILAIVGFFQFAVLQKPVANLGEIAIGFDPAIQGHAAPGPGFPSFQQYIGSKGRARR